MSKAKDPALYESNFERIPMERYWTDPWVTEALLDVWRDKAYTNLGNCVWEPSAGRGDMAKVLIDRGHWVLATDIDLSEFPEGLCDSMNHDFLKKYRKLNMDGFTSIVMNPPYDHAEDFVRRALAFGDVNQVAALLRTEFRQASSRMDLFEQAPYAFEVALTTRPRWDWWFRDKPQSSPRHNFSWFVWDRNWDRDSTTYWYKKPKAKKESKA